MTRLAGSPFMTAGLKVVLALAMFGSFLAWGRLISTSEEASKRNLARRERTLQRVATHISDFSPASEPLALPRCGSVRPPEALLTPDPLVSVQDEDPQVRVSFIVGADGHVHAAFVLDSGGEVEDQAVLHAIRYWRYRPALCNGVPTDSEARIRFSLH